MTVVTVFLPFNAKIIAFQLSHLFATKCSLLFHKLLTRYTLYLSELNLTSLGVYNFHFVPEISGKFARQSFISFPFVSTAFSDRNHNPKNELERRYISTLTPSPRHGNKS